MENHINPTQVFTNACITGDNTAIENLIKNGSFDVNAMVEVPGEGLRRALYYAITHNNRLAELLLQKGADAAVKNEKGQALHILPIQKAFCNNDLEGMKLLIKYNSHNEPVILISMLSLNGICDSVMHNFVSLASNRIGSAKNSYEICEKMLNLISDWATEKLPDEPALLPVKKYFKLIKSIKENDIFCATKTFSHDYEIINHYLQINSRYHPLAIAAILKRVEIFKFFLNKMANNSSYGKISTEIQFCIQLGVECRFMELMLLKNVKEFEIDRKLIFGACMGGHFGLLKLLLKNYQSETQTFHPSQHYHLRFEDVEKKYRIELEYILFSIIHYQEVRIGHVQMIDYLLQPEIIESITGVSYWEIHQDLYVENCSTYALLLNFGADIEESFPIRNFLAHQCLLDDPLKCKVIGYYKKMYLLNQQLINYKVAKGFIPFLDEWNEIKNKDVQVYQDEIDQLKKFKISVKTVANPPMSLFGFLCLSPTHAARYSRNRCLLNKYKDNNEDFRNEYVHYGWCLNGKLNRGIERRKLTEIAETSFYTALGNSIPDQLTDEIFRHFSNKQLKNYCQE